MSFQFKESTVTLENYKKIFDSCTPDVLDEIRSAVLDDTPIASFIDECGTDSYKLGQIRIGLREMLPLGFLNTNLTGRTIYLIRQCLKNNISVDDLFVYVNEDKLLLPSTTVEKLAEFLYLGADISMVDFTKVKENKIDLVLQGLLYHYPMWLILDEDYPIPYMKGLMRGMQLEIDITPFLSGNWSEQQMFLLFSYSKRIDIVDFMSKINEQFDIESLKVLLKLYKENVPITTLCVQDKDGTPVYNSYQIEELSKAIKDKTITHEMYNPLLSDIQMKELHEIELEKRKPKPKKIKLSGVTDING